ncbi:hypothetical protein ACRN9C_20465 [Shewanella frigidimarina]|uniref:Uncharacterized protein n=1 Tax=Shewanella polaris TaxID=2588449 RepID=A0A4Y5YI43_9GAMM|nr:hypothetical protein [Shewanella polaris]QDE32374.1 hypothetical protein FH971_16230 [Shewanella polaris]
MNNFVLISHKYIKSQAVLQAILTLDVDVEAERVAVLDRVTLQPMHNITAVSSNFSVILPLDYGSIKKVIVGIIDDDEVHNCQFIDGVSAEILDVNAVLRI